MKFPCIEIIAIEVLDIEHIKGQNSTLQYLEIGTRKMLEH